jgi:hypothetical protein
MTMIRNTHSGPNIELARRYFLRDCGYGLGKIALASLLANGAKQTANAALAESPLTERKPHFPPTAKRVIHLFMSGARVYSIGRVGTGASFSIFEAWRVRS